MWAKPVPVPVLVLWRLSVGKGMGMGRGFRFVTSSGAWGWEEALCTESVRGGSGSEAGLGCGFEMLVQMNRWFSFP